MLLKILFRDNKVGKDRIIYMAEENGTYKRLGASQAAGEIVLAITQLSPGDAPRRIDGDLEKVISGRLGHLNGSFPAPDGKGPKGTGSVYRGVMVGSGLGVVVKELFVSKTKDNKVFLKIRFEKKRFECWDSLYDRGRE